MPLVVSGFTTLLDTAIQPKGSIFMTALAGVWLDANIDVPGKVILHTFPLNIQCDLEMDVIYYFEGKLSKNQGVFPIVEVMRLMPIPGYEDLMALRISGTADVIQVESDELVLNCQTYACGHPANFKIKAKFATKKYEKFIKTLKPKTQLFITGILTNMDSDMNLELGETDFSYSKVTYGGIASKETKSPMKIWHSEKKRNPVIQELAKEVPIKLEIDSVDAGSVSQKRSMESNSMKPSKRGRPKKKPVWMSDFNLNEKNALATEQVIENDSTFLPEPAIDE
jgi:hypothetical protein